MRAGLSEGKVVALVLEMIDAGEPVTLAAVAARAGVAAPSLYKHIRGLEDLRDLIAIRVLDQMTAQFSAAIAGRSGDDAVRALLDAYRRFVAAHPGRYAAVPLDPLGSPALASAGEALLRTCTAALRGYGLDADGTVHALRILRTVAHGFSQLEANGGFGLPQDTDETYRRLIELLIGDLAELSREDTH